MTLARCLAGFAASLDFATLPPTVVDSVRLRTLDVLGIALAASATEAALPVLGALDGWAATGDYTVLGSKRTVAAPLAILANGTLAHSLDFDDTHAASITHASAVVVPVGWGGPPRRRVGGGGGGPAGGVGVRVCPPPRPH